MQVGKCLELRIDARAMDEETFRQLADSLDSLGQSLETDHASGRQTHVAWFEAGGDVQRQRARLKAALLLIGVEESDAGIRLLDETDWSTAWQKDWHGTQVGKRLWVRPSFCPPPSTEMVDIQLDPGMAFGTGTHATTRLCLQAIEDICIAEHPVTLLDMGAGSGILAIAGLKLGIKHAVAIDIEENSVEACQANARLNQVSMDVRLDDTPPNRRFDLVVANILAAPLIDMAPRLAACAGGRLVLSGLLQSQVEAVSAAYKQQGLIIDAVDVEDDWAAIRLHRVTP